MSTLIFNDLLNGIKTLAGLDWGTIKKEFEEKDWAQLGFTSVEGILKVLEPLVPQAPVAEDITKLIAQFIHNMPQDNNAPIEPKQVIDAIWLAMGIDWNQLYAVMMGNSPAVAGVVLIDDLAKIIVPFFPPAAPVIKILDVLAIIGLHTHPAQVEDPSMEKATGGGGDPWNNPEPLGAVISS